MSSSSFLFHLPRDLVLSNLLNIIWILALLIIITSSLPLKHLSFFHAALSRVSARGKTAAAYPSRFSLPQRWFQHFYIFAFVLVTILLLLSADLNTVFLLVMMEVQVIRRLYENLFVFRFGPQARMHVLGYFTGFFFYIMAPLSVGGIHALDALNSEGCQISQFIIMCQPQIPVWKPLGNLGWYQWTGFVIFIWGWLHQLRCHVILGSLRKHKRADEYVIPHGDWFEYVSSPHYLAEIVIYAGILVASGGSNVTIWLLFSFVVANLAFAAAESHRWYHRNFALNPGVLSFL